MARKPVEWSDNDIRQFKELCSIFCTEAEICSILGVSDKTLVRLINKYLRDEITPGSRSPVTFEQAFEHYSAEGKRSLRRAQLAAAEAGDRQMLLWLGKQYLGQVDKKEVTQQATIKTEKPKEAAPIDDLYKRAARLGDPA